MKRFTTACFAIATLLTLSSARASFHTFHIDELYSNADGSVQFIVLHEASGASGQQFLAGHALQSSGSGGPKTFVFPNNLPSSPSTAGRRALIATSGFVALGIVTPDYEMPNGFLSLTGGSLDYGGADFVSYAALPTDGVNALYRNGSAGANVATNFAGQSASVQAPPPPPPAPDLNQHGLTGSWYEPATDGQGFEVEMFAAPGQGSTQVSWFTYDTVVGGAERQRWYTLSGPVVTGQPTASLKIYQNIGGNFNAPPGTSGVQVGTATLSFDTCTSGQLQYTFTDGSGRTGTIPLTRITQNVTCSTTSARPTNADFALSGNWYNAATDGQGVTIEVNPNNGSVFVPWYTYAPGGSGAGVAGQRWYTISGNFAAGSRSIPVKISETTGGKFDTPTVPAPKSQLAGGGTLVFQSCTSATLDYNFTGGSSIGAHGTIALTRIGPVPPGCK